MVMDIDHQNFKYVWFKKPKALEAETTLQYKVGDVVDLEGDKQLTFAIDSYQHTTQKLGIDPLIIWVGDKSAVKQQLVNMYDSLELRDGGGSSFKLVVNVEKMQPSSSAASRSTASRSTASTGESGKKSTSSPQASQ